MHSTLRLNVFSLCAVLGLTVVSGAFQASAQEDVLVKQIRSLQWQSYPSIGSFGSTAQIKLTSDIWFLDAPNTRRFLELNDNPPRDNQYTIAPRSLDWFAVFAFDPTGFVKDDERLEVVPVV
jgi:uncharacterized membrane-anchored protein